MSIFQHSFLQLQQYILQMDSNKHLIPLFDPDINIKLDGSLFKDRLTAQECKIMHFFKLSREIIAAKKNTSRILMFDYEDKIICNREFTINYTVYGNSTIKKTDFVFEILKDDAQDLVYFLFEPRKNPIKSIFHWTTYTVPYNKFTVDDYRTLVSKIISEQEINKIDAHMSIGLVEHHINFDTGKWIINQL